MTTIVCSPKEGVIAYDSLATIGDMVYATDYDKHLEYEDCHFFMAGSSKDSQTIAEAYCDDEVSLNKVDYVQGFVVDGNKVYRLLLRENEDKSRVLLKELETHPFAIGSGTQFALTALDMGATAEEAVRMAIKRDIYSGGEVRVFKIK